MIVKINVTNYVSDMSGGAGEGQNWESLLESGQIFSSIICLFLRCV